MEGKGCVVQALRLASMSLISKLKLKARKPLSTRSSVYPALLVVSISKHIKAPECFEIERALIEQCDIPVFHDDQHGTAIVTAAAMINALELADKKLEDAKIALWVRVLQRPPA